MQNDKFWHMYILVTQIIKTFISPQKVPSCSFWSKCPPFLQSQPEFWIIFYYFKLALFFSCISYKWDDTLCTLFSLTSLAQHNIHEIYICHCMYQVVCHYLLLSYISLCEYTMISWSIFLLLVLGIFFQFGALRNSYENACVYKLVCPLIPPGYMPRSAVTRS